MTFTIKVEVTRAMLEWAAYMMTEFGAPMPTKTQALQYLRYQISQFGIHPDSLFSSNWNENGPDDEKRFKAAQQWARKWST